MLWLVLPAALAADTWTEPHPGVRWLHRTATGPLQIHVLEVDLCERGVSLRATAESERQRTVSSFGALVGAQAAINADFFSYDGYWPVGFAVANGTAWADDSTSEGFVAFGRDKAWISPPSELWSDPASWMDQAVGGRPHLVKGGVAGGSFSDPSHCSERHPRSAVGLSRDRRTLWLAVVDGRSSASIGMTCDELADLMDGLGAWDALNLDGGGSTAMWVEGEGVLNDPSDGSERVVANHLAVFADGSGAAESCDFWQEEVNDQAGAHDAGSTDVDGDGTADACARAAAGFRCQPSTGSGFADPWVLPDLSNDAGFGDEPHYATIRMADFDGNGLADVCARGADGVSCWPSTGSGWGSEWTGAGLSDASGWSDPKYYSTLRWGDVDGDGDDDACARAAAGIRCYTSTPAGVGTTIVGPELSDAAGWGEPDHYGTIALGDVSGDGRDDLCARAGAGVWCWLSDGAGFPTRIDGPAWSDTDGWSDVAYWSTIRLADVDADGLADLCGRGPDGMTCHLSTGDGFGDAIPGPALTDGSGWDDHSNYGTIRLGDVDGDGDLDVCARANVQAYCWLFDGAGFSSRIDGPAWTDEVGWDDRRYYGTIRLGDVTGDGRADLCARSSAGFDCYASDGAGFPTKIAGPTWSDASGWAGEQYATTIRLAGPAPAPDEPADTDAPADTDLADTDPVDTGDPASNPRREQGEAGGCGCATGGSPLPAAAVLATLLLGRRSWRRSAA